jgi:hypothetical protein
MRFYLNPNLSAESAGDAIPIADNAATASAFRPTAQPARQRECTQT